MRDPFGSGSEFETLMREVYNVNVKGYGKNYVENICVEDPHLNPDSERIRMFERI